MNAITGQRQHTKSNSTIFPTLYELLHCYTDGYTVTKLLHNRGRLRKFFSVVLTKIMRKKLESLRKGAINLPVSGSSKMPPISLTSWSPRFSSLPLVLLNLLDQDTLPSRIYVWLAAHDYDLLDSELVELFENSIVEFRQTKDYGSHKKWLPLALETDKPFVICDDDIFYPKSWYKSLVASDDGKAYVAHRCHSIRFDSKGSFLPYELWTKDIQKAQSSSHYLFPVGCGGTLIYPTRISSQFRDWDRISRLCPKADDIWLKLAHLESGVPCRKSAYSFPYLDYVDSQEVSLMQTNVNLGGNDRQIKQSLTELQLNLDILSF